MKDNLNKDKLNSNSPTDRKLRRRELMNRTGKCDRCPPHGGMDNGPCKAFGRRPRTDRYKNKR